MSAARTASEAGHRGSLGAGLEAEPRTLRRSESITGLLCPPTMEPGGLMRPIPVSVVGSSSLPLIARHHPWPLPRSMELERRCPAAPGSRTRPLGHQQRSGYRRVIPRREHVSARLKVYRHFLRLSRVHHRQVHPIQREAVDPRPSVLDAYPLAALDDERRRLDGGIPYRQGGLPLRGRGRSRGVPSSSPTNQLGGSGCSVAGDWGPQAARARAKATRTAGIP